MTLCVLHITGLFLELSGFALNIARVANKSFHNNVFVKNMNEYTFINVVALHMTVFVSTMT